MPERETDQHNVSKALLRSEHAKRWTKRYRTEVAASTSSLLSTFAAVRNRASITAALALTPPSTLSTRSSRASRRTHPRLRPLCPPAQDLTREQLRIQILYRLRPAHLQDRRPARLLSWCARLPLIIGRAPADVPSQAYGRRSQA